VDEAWALDAVAVTLPAALPAVVVVALREAECTEEMVVVLKEDEIMALMEAWTLEMDAVLLRGVETVAVEATSERRMGR
jgi:hypothetical protein